MQEEDGLPRTVMSDGVGFYAVAVRAGTIWIAASKVGYATERASLKSLVSFSIRDAAWDRDAHQARACLLGALTG